MSMRRAHGNPGIAILAALALAGCANELGAREEDHAHDSFEMTSSSEELLAQWTREGEWLVSPLLEVPDGASRAGALVGLTSAGEMPAMEAPSRCWMTLTLSEGTTSPSATEN